MSLNPAIFWLILSKSRHMAFSGAYFRCLFDKFKSTGPNVVHISRNDLCVVLDITKQGRVELKTHAAVCLVLITRPRCHVSIGQWEDKQGEKRTNEKLWRERETRTTPRPARGQTVIFIIIADLHKRLSMEMLLEECFCSVIMETIFQQGSWPRPASPQSGIFSRGPSIFQDPRTTQGLIPFTNRTLAFSHSY